MTTPNICDDMPLEKFWEAPARKMIEAYRKEMAEAAGIAVPKTEPEDDADYAGVGISDDSGIEDDI